MGRVKWVESRKELERSVDEFITRGYTIRSANEQSVRVQKKDWGDAGVHLLIAALTIWWTLGLANALYAVYKRATAEEVLIRVAEQDTDKRLSSETNLDQDRLDKRSSDNTAHGTRGGNDNIPTAATVGDGTAATVEVDADGALASQQPQRQETQSSRPRRSNRIRQAVRLPSQFLLQAISIAVAMFVLFTILAVYAGDVGLDTVGLVTATLLVTVLFRYTVVYHRFGQSLHKNVAAGLSFIAFIGVSVFTFRSFAITAQFSQIRQTFQDSPFQLRLEAALPEWWIAILLAIAGILATIGTVAAWDFEQYSKPTSIREIASSPVYLGTTGTLFGLWAVLFVGIGIQRIIVIAPLFEESLKFGIALLVGGVLFGRSLSGRIASAIIVGSLFGFIEHATSYPAEANTIFLFRTLFHMMTTVVSVSVYTTFESHSDKDLLWIAPVYPICIHFFYNTFVILSSFVLALIGFSTPIASQLYGGAAILLLTLLFTLVITRYKTARKLHTPFKQVLSDIA